MRAAGAQRLMRGLGGEHAGKDRVMRALDPREIDKAGGAADQRAAGEDEFRRRLPAARADRPCAIGEALAAEECAGDQRMGLEALEFVERREGRIDVIEMDDKADGDEIVVVMVKERAAARAAPERPTERVLDEATLELGRIDRPDFLEADAEFLRLPPLLQPVAGEQLLCQRAARAFGDERIFAAQLHAAGEAGFRLAVAADAHIAGGDAEDLAFAPVKNFGGGETRIDFNAQSLRP